MTVMTHVELSVRQGWNLARLSARASQKKNVQTCLFADMCHKRCLPLLAIVKNRVINNSNSLQLARLD